MSKYRSAGYRKSARGSKISPDAVVIVKLKGHPQMQFSSYRTPWNGWTISPTLAGQKIQQAMIGYGATK